MSDKTRIEQEKQASHFASSDNFQKEVNDSEQDQKIRLQSQMENPSYQARFIKWPLIIGPIVLVVVLLELGYFYGSGVVDELGSVLLAIALTLLVIGITAIFWWLQRSK
jgi:hypothetical protein